METAIDRFNARVNRKYPQVTVNGVTYLGDAERQVQIKSLKIRPDDVAIVCYPKSGTHWLYHILSYLNTDGDLNKAQHYRFVPLEVTPHNLSKTPVELFEAAPSPRVFATHLPFELCPDELQAGKCKIIYIIRNPKDVAVSYFYFYKGLKVAGNFEDFSWADFVEVFCDPVTLHYGSWFANVKNWLQHRNDSNVLTVFYEDLKKNLAVGVSKVAEFVGRPVSGERAAEIARLCDFSTMQKSGLSENDELNANSVLNFYLRKGVIGDWKNHFTRAQNEMFDAVIQREMAGWDLPLQFD